MENLSSFDGPQSSTTITTFICGIIKPSPASNLLPGILATKGSINTRWGILYFAISSYLSCTNQISSAEKPFLESSYSKICSPPSTNSAICSGDKSSYLSPCISDEYHHSSVFKTFAISEIVSCIRLYSFSS